MSIQKTNVIEQTVLLLFHVKDSSWLGGVPAFGAPQAVRSDEITPTFLDRAAAVGCPCIHAKLVVDPGVKATVEAVISDGVVWSEEFSTMT
ncbi:hypothetical protein PR202_gb20545 [Eleusine coracana subsp. coracana]|uniref:Uncharacterized protein n=1 Tax=Eleusine coracana subsp. coracana TaxID=191504 RepID=A0AAV5FAP2_ELECO|nr:hypothetical protein PR202_gb20545 [Eleusine coracana subsp. coracana]